MSDIYEGGSEAPDLIYTTGANIYSTAMEIDDLMWEWASGSDLSFDFISSELKYADMTTKYKPRIVQDKRRKERDDPRFDRRLDIEGR